MKPPAKATAKASKTAGFMAVAMVVWLQALFLAKNGTITFLDKISLLGNGDTWILGVSTVLALGMLISLYFMWDVRRFKAG